MHANVNIGLLIFILWLFLINEFIHTLNMLGREMKARIQFLLESVYTVQLLSLIHISEPTRPISISVGVL